MQRRHPVCKSYKRPVGFALPPHDSARYGPGFRTCMFAAVCGNNPLRWKPAYVKDRQRAKHIGTPNALVTSNDTRSGPAVDRLSCFWPRSASHNLSAVNLSKLSPGYGDRSPSRDTACFTSPGRETAGTRRFPPSVWTACQRMTPCRNNPAHSPKSEDPVGNPSQGQPGPSVFDTVHLSRLTGSHTAQQPVAEARRKLRNRE
jgi:hypothetical protein